MVFVHGGGWTSGSPEMVYDLARLLAEYGIVSCLPQYRLLNEPGMNFKEQIEDVQTAWQLGYQEIRQRYGKELPIACGGGSAGAHLSLMAHFHPHLRENKLPLPDAWVFGNPVIDTSTEGFGNNICGPDWRDLSPRHSIDQSLRKILFLQGTGDTVTRPELAKKFIAEQKALGATVDAKWFPEAEHGFFNNETHRPKTAQHIAEFLCQ